MYHSTREIRKEDTTNNYKHKKQNNSCAWYGRVQKEDNRKRVIYSCGAQLSGIVGKTTCMQASG